MAMETEMVITPSQGDAPAAWVDATAAVEDGAVLGTGVQVWRFACVRSGAVVGADTQLGTGVYIDDGATIGARCAVQNFACVYRGVSLEDDVFVGPGVIFTNDRFPRAHNAGWEPIPTLVRTGASIGGNATIVCGVTIGRWATVAAGAVVTHDVGDHVLVAGIPARPIGWVCRCGRPLDEEPGDSCPHHDAPGKDTEAARP
jgi:UDP-2-acetamido-3-amino-2,3-dideoxy-glucuronate N-acetyltransferase